MPLFACSGYPDVEADSARKAARFFADLRAKSEYGAGGQCTFLEATAGSILTFQAFIGALSEEPSLGRLSPSALSGVPAAKNAEALADPGDES